jgi:hypothetical protein
MQHALVVPDQQCAVRDQHAGAQLAEEIADAMRQPAACLAEWQLPVIDIGAKRWVVVGRGQQVVTEAGDGVALGVGAQHRARNAAVRPWEVQLGIGHQRQLVAGERTGQLPHVQ